MVLRNPLVGDATADSLPGNSAHTSGKMVVKETQREILDIPKESMKGIQTLNRAQDVAELKDYVRIAALRTMTLAP